MLLAKYSIKMNKYEIIGIVGEGAYGIVYKAKNKDSGEYGKYKTPFGYINLLSIISTQIHPMDKSLYLLKWMELFSLAFKIDRKSNWHFI